MKNFLIVLLSVISIGLGVYILVDKDIIEFKKAPEQEENNGDEVVKTRTITVNEDFEPFSEYESCVTEDDTVYCGYDNDYPFLYKKKDFDYSKKIIDNFKIILNSKEHDITVTYKWKSDFDVSMDFYSLVYEIEIDGKKVDEEFYLGQQEHNFEKMLNYDYYRIIGNNSFEIFNSLDGKEYLLIDDFAYSSAVVIVKDNSEILTKIYSGNQEQACLYDNFFERCVEYDIGIYSFGNYEDFIDFYSVEPHSNYLKEYRFTIENDKAKYDLLSDDIEFHLEGGELNNLNVVRDGVLNWKEDLFIPSH